MINKILLYIAHYAKRELGGEDTGVLRLIFLEYIGLYSASNRRQGVSFYFLINIGRKHFIAGDAQQQQSEAVISLRQRIVRAVFTGPVFWPRKATVVIFL